MSTSTNKKLSFNRSVLSPRLLPPIYPAFHSASILLATPSLSSGALGPAASFPKSLFRESFHAFSRWATATRARWGSHERMSEKEKKHRNDPTAPVPVCGTCERDNCGSPENQRDFRFIRHFHPPPFSPHFFYPSPPVTRSSTLAQHNCQCSFFFFAHGF